jgi:hypothetical protein
MATKTERPAQRSGVDVYAAAPVDAHRQRCGGRSPGGRRVWTRERRGKQEIDSVRWRGASAARRGGEGLAAAQHHGLHEGACIGRVRDGHVQPRGAFHSW